MPTLPLPAIFAAAFLAFAPVPGGAQTTPPVVQSTPSQEIALLIATLQIGGVMDVMRSEGLDYGKQMETEMFPEKGGASWQAMVELIYDPKVMRDRFETAFAARIADKPALIPAIQGFFETPQGQQILALETEARRSMLDQSVEDAAHARLEDMVAATDPRLDMLRTFAEVNDLIESNVSGALNANLAFFQGMAEVNVLGEDMTDEQMLADVWEQEPDIRMETEDWLFPYLALAYGPLSDQALRDYTDFSRTDAGRALNAALFAAFDAVFTTISRDLGRAAARQIMGEDI